MFEALKTNRFSLNYKDQNPKLLWHLFEIYAWVIFVERVVFQIPVIRVFMIILTSFCFPVGRIRMKVS